MKKILWTSVFIIFVLDLFVFIPMTAIDVGDAWQPPEWFQVGNTIFLLVIVTYIMGRYISNKNNK